LTFGRSSRLMDFLNVQKSVEVQWTNYTTGELGYVISKVCLGGKKLTGPYEDTPKAQELATLLMDKFQMHATLFKEFAAKNNKIATTISPFNAPTLAAQKGFEVTCVAKVGSTGLVRQTTITPVSDTAKVEAPKQTVEQKFAYVDPVGFKNVIPTARPLPFDVSYASLAYFGGMLTKWAESPKGLVPNGVVNTYPFTAGAAEKIGLDHARIPAFQHALASIMKDFKSFDLSGPDWAHAIYQYVTTKYGPNVGRYMSVTALGCLWGPVNEVTVRGRLLMSHVSEKMHKMLLQAAKDEALATRVAFDPKFEYVRLTDKGFPGSQPVVGRYVEPPMAVQTNVLTVPTNIDFSKITIAESFAAFTSAREIRGKGDSTVTAMLHGAYLGTILTKPVAVLMSKVGVLANFNFKAAGINGFVVINSDVNQNRTFLKTINFASQVTPAQGVATILFKASTAHDKDYIARTDLENCRGRVIFDFDAPAFASIKKGELVTKLFTDTMVTVTTRLRSLATLEPEIIVLVTPVLADIETFKVGSIVYDVAVYPGPMPHTLHHVVVASRSGLSYDSIVKKCPFARLAHVEYIAIGTRNCHYAFQCPIYDVLPAPCVRMCGYSPVVVKLKLGELAEFSMSSGYQVELDVEDILARVARRVVPPDGGHRAVEREEYASDGDERLGRQDDGAGDLEEAPPITADANILTMFGSIGSSVSVTPRPSSTIGSDLN